MKKIIVIIVIIILGFLAFFIGKAYASSNNSNNKSSIENNNNLNNSSTDSINNESTNSSQVNTTNNSTNENTSSNNKVNTSNSNPTNSRLTQTQINELSTKAMLYEFNTLGKKYMTRNQLPTNYSYGDKVRLDSGYGVSASKIKVIVGDSKNIDGKTYYKVKLMYIPYEKYGQDFATLDVLYIDLDGNIIPDNNANTILNSNTNSDITATIETPLVTPLMYQKIMQGAVANQLIPTPKDFVFNQSQSDIFGYMMGIIILNGTPYYNVKLASKSMQEAGGTGTIANEFVYINGNNPPKNIQKQLTNIEDKLLGI